MLVMYLTKAHITQLLYLPGFKSLKMVRQLCSSSSVPRPWGCPLRDGSGPWAVSHCHKVTLHRTGACRDTVYIPENKIRLHSKGTMGGSVSNSVHAPCPGFSSRLRGNSEHALVKIPRFSVETSNGRHDSLSYLGKV